MARKKSKNNIKDDILEIGLINSTSKIKDNRENSINNLKKKKFANKKTEIAKESNIYENKKSIFKINNIYVHSSMIFSLLNKKINK